MRWTRTSFISRALSRIEAGDAPETELHNVRVYLLTTHNLIEPDPTITEAADDLSRLTAQCAHEQEREVLIEDKPPVRPDHVRAMNDAFLRFHNPRSASRPNKQALKLGLD